VASSPDARTVAAEFVNGTSGGVFLWDVASGKRLGKFPLDVLNDGRPHLAFSPDGKTLAAGYGHHDYESHEDRGVRLWDVGGGKLLGDLALNAAEDRPGNMAFSPDGKTLAVGCGRGEGKCVSLWNVVARKRLGDLPLDVTEGSPGDLAFSPDGKTLAVRYDNSNLGGEAVLLWDVAARGRLSDEPLSVAGAYIRNFAFSPDGKTLAAGYRSKSERSIHGGVVLWDLDLESWKRKAGEIANRNFTKAEWLEYLPDQPSYRKTFDWLPEAPETKTGTKAKMQVGTPPAPETPSTPKAKPTG
jgi:WD40 repeat protein